MNTGMRTVMKRVVLLGFCIFFIIIVYIIMGGSYLKILPGGLIFSVSRESTLVNDPSGYFSSVSYDTDYFKSLLKFYEYDIDKVSEIVFYDRNVGSENLREKIINEENPIIYVYISGDILVLLNFVDSADELETILDFESQSIEKISKNVVSDRKNKRYKLSLVSIYIYKNSVNDENIHDSENFYKVYQDFDKEGLNDFLSEFDEIRNSFN